MSLDAKFFPIRDNFYKAISDFFDAIAKLFRYPINRGMPRISTLPENPRTKFFESLPKHKTYWPPLEKPENWFEMILGPSPKVDLVPKYFYGNKIEGYYNFYIENYKNIFFIPDSLSEFLQVKCNICLDLTALESIREILFTALVVYSNLILVRIGMSWFLSINPFSRPWCYISATVDWTEEILQGVMPVLFGVNITSTVFLGLLGVIADGLNHLVLTMPFLPSEGEEVKVFMNDQVKDVLVFHYLPILWYRYPIPNDLREYWYNERPEVINYMKKAYTPVGVQFWPDDIIEESKQKILTSYFSNHFQFNSELLGHPLIPSELLATNNFLTTFHSFHQHF